MTEGSKYIRHIHELSITESIRKNPHERHIGIIGDMSHNKLTFLNTMFGLSLPATLDCYTTKCKPFHRIQKGDDTTIYWNIPGKNSDFQSHNFESLLFINSLNICLILYDDNIAAIHDTLNVVTRVCFSKVITVRTKLDQYSTNSGNTCTKEKICDDVAIANVWVKHPHDNLHHHVIPSNLAIDQYNWAILCKEII